jgi:hypothetical protein
VIREVDGVRRGDAADAGALCKTERSRDGVSADTYRRMISQLGAPGPLPGFNPEDGHREYDLGAVERWNAERPGQNKGSWHRDIRHRTPMRDEFLSAVAAGEVTVRLQPPTLKAELFRGETPLDTRAHSKVYGEFARAEMVATPEVGGKLELTEAGRELLAEWKAMDAEPAAC